MLEFMNEWLGNFSGYLILLTVIIHVIPNNDFQKYVRFLCGLILILLMMSPVIEMLGMEETFWEVYYNREHEMVISEFEEQVKSLTEE